MTLFLLLFIFFLIIYGSQTTNYKERKEREKVTLTEEKIKEFEKDVSEGKDIDIKNYLDNPKHRYNNSISDASLKVSFTIENLFNKGVGFLIKTLEDTVQEK